jgi:hypothetical protein
MTKELESKYKDELHFKFIEDLDFTKRSNWDKKYDFLESVINFNGDEIFIQNLNKTWFVWDSITDNEEASDNKVLANIDFLKTQHRVLGIQQSLSRGF